MTAARKSALRRFLLLLGPLAVLVAGGWLYLTSGRFMGTDNAYVKSDVIMLSPEVTGKIIDVKVTDNQHVFKDDVLLTIDPEPYAIALAKAKADLVNARATIEELKAQYRQKEESMKLARDTLSYQKRQYSRQEALKKENYASQARVDEATLDLKTAQQDIAKLEQERAEILAKLEGDADIAVEDHPVYKSALATLERAELDLRHTTLIAPFDGTTGEAPHVGDFARLAAPLMSLVGQDVWIEANYKETDLTNVQPGQNVEVKVDTYPDRVWHGTVDSISPATGAEFSVLPAQNATGNWVKVVQRVPVRIRIDRKDSDPVLRSGMSTEISIDTGRYPHMPAAFARDAGQ